MKKCLPTRTLREHPDLDQLKRQAKELLAAFRSGEPDAVSEVTAHYHGADARKFALHDAQLVVARAYGFDSWPKLKAYVDGVTISRLGEVVRAGDLEQVHAMLRIRPELARMDMAEDDERQALHWAVIARRPEMVRLLMQYGADPRKGIYPHRDATTALTLATDRAYDEIAAIIREEERKSPETLRVDNSRRPLPPEWLEAARRGDQALLIACLSENPWLMQVHMEHPLMTPLHTAVANLWDQVTVWLLDRGADVNARINGGPSPLEIVGCGSLAKGASVERIAALAAILRSRGAELSPRAAVAYGESAWLRARYAEGNLVNGLPRNQGYRGLVEMAVHYNQPEILKLLLDLGFDPDEVLRKGDTGEFMRGGPLRECAQTGRHAMAEMLLARGATLTAHVAVALGLGDWLREHIGEETGLLLTAVTSDRLDMLALLLELGLDPDERVRLEGLEEIVYSGGGPLHHCASSGKLAMAEMLLAKGADPNLHVYAAGSPLFKAYQKQDAAMIALLEKYGGVVDASTAGLLRLREKARLLVADNAEELLFYAADGGDPEIVAMALERLDWARDDPRWQRMLMRTLGYREEPDRGRYLTCFELILKRHQPGQGKSGRTMLHELAASWPQPPTSTPECLAMATMLLNAGARMDVRDDLLKSTPLGWACRWGRAELAGLLLERGADPEEPKSEPWAKPRAWAEKMKHAAVVTLLDAGHR